MFRLSRKDIATSKITHSLDQPTNVLHVETIKDWIAWGPYDLIIVDITQELADKDLAKQKKQDALSNLNIVNMAAVTTLPALINIVKDLVELNKK